MPRLGADVYPLALLPEQAQDLRRFVPGAAEPVRHSGVELGRLSPRQDELVLAEEKSHAAGQDVQPLVALVRAEFGLDGRNGDEDLPGLNAAGLRGERNDGPPAGALRLEA